MIGLFFCKTFGEVIGEISDSNLDENNMIQSSDIVISNPERVQLTSQGGMVLPILAMSSEKELSINESELISMKVYKLDNEIEKQYRERYGKVVLPSSKLQLLD